MPEYNEGCTGYADGSISDTPFLFLFFIFVSSLSLCLPPSLYPCTQGESIMTVGGPNNSSSEIGRDKVILLHNKAHGEAEQTEGKNITEVPTAQESDREVTYGAFIFGINTIHNSHRQMP